MKVRSVVLTLLIIIGSAGNEASEAAQINQTPIHRNSFLKKPKTYKQYAISSCGGPCCTLNDCSGQLICIDSKCADDPDVGTHICSGMPTKNGNNKQVVDAGQ